MAAGAVALALAAGSGATAAVLHDRAQTARLAAAAGGVVDLRTPVRSIWSTRFETSVALDAYPVGPVGVLEDERGRELAVVAVPDFALSDPPSAIADDRREPGWQLHGIDLDSGAQRWTVPVGEGSSCGSELDALGLDRSAQPTVERRLVCTRGQGAGSRVVVVRPDGTTTVRTPDALTATTRLRPGPGGSVWRTERPGPLPAEVALVSDPGWGWRFSDAFDAPPVRLSAEDAVTGEELWSTTLPGDRIQARDDWTRCTDHGREQAVFDVGALEASVSNDGAVLDVCGFTIVVAADGTVLGQHPSSSRALTSWPRVRSLADGGLAVGEMVAGESWSGPWTRPSTLYDREGRPVAHLDGGVLDPLASDGSAGAARARGDGVYVVLDGARVRGVRADGEPLWSRVDRPAVLGAVAQARGVLVLARYGTTTEGELVGYDVANGARLWTAPLDVFGPGGGTEVYVRGAWTDGRVVVVVTPGTWAVPSSPAWTAYDLRTGAQVWRLGPDQVAGMLTPAARCLAVAGRLLCFDGAQVMRVA